MKYRRLPIMRAPPRIDRGDPVQEIRHPQAIPGGSAFRDDEWYFRTETAGHPGAVVLYWNLPHPGIDDPEWDGLDEDEWLELLHRSKLLVWSLLDFNKRGANIKFETLPRIYYPLLFLIRWMARENIPAFAHIGPTEAEKYLDELAWAKGKGAEKPRTSLTLANYADILCRIHEQGSLASSKHHRIMERHPFDGRAAHAVAKNLTTNRKKGWIQPVPDDVWLPVVQTALEMLDGPVEVIALLGEIVAGFDPANSDIRDTGTGLHDAVANHDEGHAIIAWLRLEARRWMPDLDADRPMADRHLRRLYRLILLDLRDACTIVLQSMLGIRISEVAGLKAEPCAETTGWPDCVRVRDSLSGSNDIFYVKGYLFKGQPRPKPTEWVAGSRPCGTEHVPTVIRALIALERIYRPWRRLAKSEELLVAIGGGLQIREPRFQIWEIRSSDLDAGQRRFVSRHVALPPPYGQYRLRSHQWRKNFALYMVRSDERSLAAISDHFKHLSVASTDQSYVGRDAGLLGVLEDIGVRTAAKTLLDACEGKVTISGRMAKTVTERAPNILRACNAFGSEEEKVESLTLLLKDDDIRVWPSDWGRCLFRAEKAKCHLEAGAIDLRAAQPDHGHRHPNVCCGCANLLVMDAHRDFWTERKEENEAFVGSCTAEGNVEGALAARRRLETAQRILDGLALRTDNARRVNANGR